MYFHLYCKLRCFWRSLHHSGINFTLLPAVTALTNFTSEIKLNHNIPSHFPFNTATFPVWFYFHWMQRRDLLADDPTVKLEIKGDKVPQFGYSVELFHLCIICIFLPSSSTLICLIFVHSFHHLLLTSSSYSITIAFRLLVLMSIPSILFQVAPTYSKLALPIGYYFVFHLCFVIMFLFTFLWCLGLGFVEIFCPHFEWILYEKIGILFIVYCPSII